MNKGILKRTGLVAGLLAFGGVTTVGVAGAAASSTTHIIYACYAKGDGSARILRPGQTCKGTEYQVQWNEQGPQGERGPAGPRGATGPAGAPGTPGAPGGGVTATFAFAPDGGVALPADTWELMASKHLDPGAYTIVATANLSTDSNFVTDNITDGACELRRSDGGGIGSAVAREFVPEGEDGKFSLSLNGGAAIADGPGVDVSLWCRVQDGGHGDGAQMMISRIAGFF